jgi:predicted Rossmann fold nucleotide-binding protein DprA/Smf involved in DNA uptake
MPVIEFSKSMNTTLKNSDYVDAIGSQNMLIFSEVNPLRKLSRIEATAHFMNRNKYIYAMSEYTVVVRSAVGPKSGTWSGAKEAIDRKITKVYVREVNEYAGNMDLIRLGGKPIS